MLDAVPADPAWDVPHRLVAAVRFLALGGEVEDFERADDAWEAFRAAVGARRDDVSRFVREQPVQTNEVQRCFALLPLFLLVARAAGRPLDLVELGASAGFNLLWDRYRYAYRAGRWGGGRLELSGVEGVPVPGELLGTRVEVGRRLGVDLRPVDATSEAGLRLLFAFTGDEAARDRIRRAAETLREAPPSLVEGDYLEILPALLARRRPEALTVVFQTHSTIYLPLEQRLRLRRIVDEAGAEAPLAWIATPTPEEHGERRGDYPLEVAVWPPGERRIVARTDVRGDRLDWIG